jgi:hypothetical protein
VAVVAEGRLCSAGRIETRPAALELFAQSLDPRDWVALEVTRNAWAIARILEPRVARVIVVSRSDTGIMHARAKTDRLDARLGAAALSGPTGWGSKGAPQSQTPDYPKDRYVRIPGVKAAR